MWIGYSRCRVKESTEHQLQLPEAQRILDEDHYGLRETERKRVGIPRCSTTCQTPQGTYYLPRWSSRGWKNLAR